MTFQERYLRVLGQTTDLGTQQRRARAKLALVRSQLRTAAEDPLSEVSTPDESTSPTPPLVISKETLRELNSLGYLASDIAKMTPDVAQQLVSSGVTKKQQEQAADRREKLFDAVEEKVLRDLSLISKRMELAKKRLQKATSQVESLDASLAEVEAKREAASDLQEQERLRAKSEWIQTHIDRAEKAESSIRKELEALDKLVSSISKTEDGLINELQEASDSAALTPGTGDDKLIEQLMGVKLKELNDIARLRQRLFGVQRSLDKKYDSLLKNHKDIADLIDAGGSKIEVNTLKRKVMMLQSEVDTLSKEQQEIVRDILRHEDRLRDVSTEQRLQELDNALKDLPNISQVKDKAKEEVQQDDLGKSIASKPQKYKKKAEEITAYADKVSQQYGDFILHYLGPDIPSDPRVEAFIRAANAAILKRARAAKPLAETYSRNPMHRAAVSLVPSLYEFLASTMEGVVAKEEKQASLETEVEQLITAGLVKEALELQELADKARSFGRGVGDAAKWSKEKTKQLGKGISNLVEKGQDILDRRKFRKEDQGNRRDPSSKLLLQQQTLRRLIEIEHDLKEQMQEARVSADAARSSGDMNALNAANKIILDLQSKIKNLGERKDLFAKGLSHKPESGIMRGQEQASKRTPSDRERAALLLDANTPALISLLRESFPNDESLEQEILRHSDRIALVAKTLIREGYKAQDKYPGLPPTIHAYGQMFLAIDDALDMALRTNS